MLYSGHVYRIDNLENGNFYIGQTRTTISQRFTNHKCEARKGVVNSRLYRAMRKYGIEMFTIESIEQLAAESKEDLSNMLNEREIYHISTLKPTYNIAPGGRGHNGIPWTDERRVKMSEMMSGENNCNFGKSLSEETKQKLSEALKGRIISEETRIKTSETMKGVCKSEETRKKMKEAANKRPPRPVGKDNKKSKAVDQYDMDETFIRTFGSIGEAARELGLQVNGICLCCKGTLKTSGKFIWKYHTK